MTDSDSRRSRSSPGPTGEMPFLDHLEELRWRVFKILIALIIGTAVGLVLVLYFDAMELLIRPIRPYLTGDRLLFFNPVTPFFFTMKLGIIVGILLALPVVIFQIWAFLSPALRPEEKKVIVPSLYAGLLLFCLGVVLCYTMVLPLALRFLIGFQREYLEAAIEAGEYLAFVTRLLLAFGFAFELPVVIVILSALGVVTPTFLREKRKYAIVAATVLASFLTPGDLPSTFMMMVPLIVLYEISIVLSASIHGRRAKRKEEPLRPSPEPPSGAVESGP